MSATISLYGMMGVGKSTVGRALARRLGRRLVDTDAEIRRWTGHSIPDIFAREGEVAFRRYEATVVRELASVPDLVLSLGGGTVLSDDNVADLTLTGALVLLDADVATLVRRVGRGRGRPLLGDDPEAALRALVAERHDRYHEVADVVVDAGGSVDDVVDRIVAWLLDHRDLLTPSELEAVLP